MDFMSAIIECIKGRRSIRKFKKDDVKDEDILLILEAASFAPSAINKQPWQFIVIKEDCLKKQMAQIIKDKLREILNKIEHEEDEKLLINYLQYFSFFENAPVVIVVLCLPIMSPIVGFLERAGFPVDELEDTVRSDIQSTSAAIQNMLLMAHDIGLGACWMTNPLIAKKELESILEVEKPWYIMSVIPVGVPASVPKISRRKKLDSIVKFINRGN
jgi:nitroreductase